MLRRAKAQGLKTLTVLVLCILLAGCRAQSSPETSAAETTAASVPETLAQAVTVPEATASETTAPETTQPEPERFLLSFVGDCTLGGDPFNANAPMGFLGTVGDDTDYPLQNVAHIFAADDFTLANLEGTLSDGGYPVQKRFRFRGPESYVSILKDHSVDAVSLANNHTMDYGKTGYENTCRVLQENGIPYVERDSTALITLDRGLTIGLYGAVYYAFDEEDMVQQLGELSRQADVVIYVPHWGSEGSYVPHDQQIRLAHLAIDSGADLVCGSHPHVLQNAEKYGDGLIFYSLGNFCFGGNIFPDDYDSVIWQQEVIRQPDGTVTLGETSLIPVCLSSRSDRNNFQPTPYEAGSEGYQRVLRKLRGQ